MDNLISVQEAARRLSVSFWTIYRWTQEGRLPSVQLGRRRLIAESDLQMFISRARTTGQRSQDQRRHQKGPAA